MKKIFFILFAFALLLSVQPPTLSAASDQGTTIVFQSDQLAPAVMAQETGGVALEPADPALIVEVPAGKTAKNFLLENWIVLSGAFLYLIDVIVRLTPTQKDNSILSWIMSFYNLIVPNNKKGGGTFQVSSK